MGGYRPLQHEKLGRKVMVADGRRVLGGGPLRPLVVWTHYPEGGQDNQDMRQAPGQDNPRTVSGQP